MISIRNIVRGAVTRTLPGVWLGFGGMIALSSVARSNVGLRPLIFMGTAGLAAAVGSAAILILLRRRLRSDADVDGRRAFLVGLGAFVVAITTRALVLNVGGTIGEHVLMGLSGALLAAAVFSPWIASPNASDSRLDSAVTGDARLLSDAQTVSGYVTRGAPQPASIRRDRDA